MDWLLSWVWVGVCGQLKSEKSPYGVIDSTSSMMADWSWPVMYWIGSSNWAQLLVTLGCSLHVMDEFIHWGSDISLGKVSGPKARHSTDVGLSPHWGKGFFSQSQLSVQTLAVFVQTLCVIAWISICVHVKNPQHWQRCHRLDTQKTTHAGRIGASLATDLALPKVMRT